MAEVTKSISVLASKEQVFKTLSEYETYPEWMPGFLHSKVIERKDGDVVCEFVAATGMKKVRYTLEMVHHEYDSIEFNQTEGDLKRFQGTWRLVPSSDRQQTMVICSTDLDPGMMAPKWMVKKAVAKSLTDNLEAIKKRLIDHPVPVEREEMVRPEEKRKGMRKLLEIVQRGPTLEVMLMGEKYEFSGLRV